MNTEIVTPTENVTRDLRASIVKEALESAGICAARQAERTARLNLALFEAASYDAALWKGAEALYGFMEARADVEPLRNRRVAERAMFLTMAVQCFASIRLTLEGGFPMESVSQGYADIQSQREQLAATPALKVVGR